MFKHISKRTGDTIEAYTYNELDVKAKEKARQTKLLDLLQELQYEMRDNESIRGMDYDDVWQALQVNTFEFFPDFDYNKETGELLWATCSYSTSDFLTFIEPLGRRHIQEKYPFATKSIQDIEIEVHFVPKTNIPKVDIVKCEINSKNESQFIEDVYNMINSADNEDYLKEIIEPVNLRLLAAIDKYVRESMEEWLEDITDLIDAPTLPEFINENRYYFFALFYKNGEEIPKHLLEG